MSINDSVLNGEPLMSDQGTSASALHTLKEKLKNLWKRSGKKIAFSALALVLLLFVGLFVSRALKKANAEPAQARTYSVQVKTITPKSEMSALEYVGSIEPEKTQQET